jgi:hypothetical protein
MSPNLTLNGPVLNIDAIDGGRVCHRAASCISRSADYMSVICCHVRCPSKLRSALWPDPLRVLRAAQRRNYAPRSGSRSASTVVPMRSASW